MLLSMKTRQRYLKELGLYGGAIDGLEGPKTRKGYLQLQKRYFVREWDRDGIYGENTDILLGNARNTKKFSPNFKLEEFRCECGGVFCTGYPARLDTQLLKNLQAVRNKYGATTITSGLRCQKFNDSIPGSINKSNHIYGKAADFANGTTGTEAGRKVVIKYWKKLPDYNYAYGNINGSHPNMGNAIHGDVK